jgi:hypothetical protein
MTLDQSRQQLAALRRERQDAEQELALQKAIRAELELGAHARVQLKQLDGETAEEKEQREEFQRRLARIYNCPEMSPDWQEQPLYSANLKPNRGGSDS